MTIDRIKISQEINFNGMPTWIGMEGLLDPDEDPKEGLRKIQKEITQYQQEEQKTYSKSSWARPEQPVISMIEQIDACTVLDKDAGGLLSFELTFKTPEEKLFYDAKLIELTKKNNQ